VAHGTSLSQLSPDALLSLTNLANLAGHDLGVNFGANGEHSDPRHTGVSTSTVTHRVNSSRSNPLLRGLAVDVGEIDHYVVGTSGAKAGLDEVTAVANAMPSVKAVIGPNGYSLSVAPGSAKHSVDDPATVRNHPTHMHLSFYGSWEVRP
jgi:hypothetical protein